MTPPVRSAVPHVSVIVPIYNVAEHVQACINSIKVQSLTNFEVLMIDDGSTDGSGEIALEAAGGDPRFRLIRQDNAGLSGARNTGLDVASGEFIAFVDSDDRVMPDYLMRLWQVLEETNGDWVSCAIQNHNPDGTGSAHSAIHGLPDMAHHTVPRRYAFDSWTDVIRHFPSAWNKLYRRALIEGLRFDKGTWFEDHGFFHRAAARTDHIIHLPELLYVQTRGRAGQITAQDDARVFEQFGVLAQIAEFFAASTRAGGPEALARIASRLLYERSTVLADPTRRAEFSRTAHEFLQVFDLDYTADRDTDLGLSWGLEMADTLPLSVILSWDGTDSDALHRSLAGVRAQSAPGHEVLIICQTKAAQCAATTSLGQIPGHWQILVAPRKGEAAGFNHGLAQARGTYVVFVAIGDVLAPCTLLERTEAMLRADADFGISQMRLRDCDTGAVTYHNGIHDMEDWPAGTPPTGLIALSPPQALTLEAQCSAKIFSRSFLEASGLRFTKGPHSDWALCLGAALLSERTVYLGQIGATVDLCGDGFDRWGAPYGAGALIRSHKALLETILHCLPPQILAQLSQGWERRLFMRALREKVYFTQYPTRVARYAMLAGAAWYAQCRRFGTPRPAGLDTFIGPRLAQIQDPVGMILAKLGVAPRLSGTQIEAKRLTGAPRVHHPFDLGTQGTVVLRVDFDTEPFANIFFRGVDSPQVLFHLSLRQATNMAVCNDQRADGQWRAERMCPVDLSARTAQITITFTPPQVFVAIDGCEIFRFGKRSLRDRNGFAKLDRIAGFTFDGAVNTPHVLPDLPQGMLSLDTRLSLRARSTDPADHLHVPTSGEVLPLIALPDGTASALLPARLWCDVAQDDVLTLELMRDAEPSALSLSRTDIATRIDKLLCLPLAPADSTLCLQVLEHVRYGDLLALISAQGRAHLETIASFYNAQSFLYSEPQDEEAAPAPARAFLSTADAIEQEIDTALARLAQSQNVAEDMAPDPLDVVAQLSVSDAARPPLFLALTGFFCVEDENFDGLHQLAHVRGVLPMEMPTDRWSLSAILPYLLLNAEYELIPDILRKLAPPGPEWLMTPAIGWTVRRAMSHAQTPVGIRDDILHAFAFLLRSRAPDYWDRMQCRELTRAVAALMSHKHRLTPMQQQIAVTLCLEVYGLSRQFWKDMAEVADLPDLMVRAQQAFGVLVDPHADPAARDDALQLFETLGTLNAPRVRRELFGPAGLSDLDISCIDTSSLNITRTKERPQLSRDMLRHMAFPDSTQVTPDVAMLAQEALPPLYPETASAPYFEAQQTAAHRAARLLAGDPDVDLDALIDTLTQLADAGSDHIGMGLALALIDGLYDVDTDRVNVLCNWLHRQMDHMARAPWRKAPALHQPARRLAQRKTLLPSVLAVLERLDLPGITQLNAPIEGSALFDTIVIVFSCAPYLDTRIPALRTGWLSLLEELGVPYLVMVGDGDGTRYGDTVHLDAPDDYEGLPQKTLAAIKWVHDNTAFGHMLKIDDDCFLNAPLFFNSLSYRKFDYYGRRLHRVPGQMDRIWHQAKSTSVRGKRDLDKSPEPSEYADGGSAYALSRTAMVAALEAAASPEGRQLINVSFMEDKMLGDLLAMRGIHVAQQDYRISIRRRMFGNSIPVPSWLNSFFPSAGAPLQLVHLDTHLDQAKALEHLASPALLPRKIWPSYQDVKLGYQSNALELISSEESVARARSAEVAVVACMRNEMFMLPHFLAHYRKLGVSAFLIADNCSDDGTLEYLVQQPDVALFSVDTDYKSSRYGVAWQQAMMSAFRLGKWSLIADADELLVWQEEQRQTLPELLQTPSFLTADAVRIFMLDMYPQGALEQADFSNGDPFTEAGFADAVPFLTNTLSRGPYSDQPCWTSALRHRLIPGSRQNLFVAQKLALLRYQPWMNLSAGLHFVGDAQIAPRELLFAHFKYNADFRRKAEAEVARGQHFNDAEEYRKYLALVCEGRSVVYDPQLSRPWTEVPFVKRRLGHSG